VTRGEIFRYPGRRRARGHEQQGARYAVVLQADELLGLSTVLVAPTSARAAPTQFRPLIDMEGVKTCVMLEQLTAVDPRRFGGSAGYLSAAELVAVDHALGLVLGIF
jgi:mRNA interferase MazF